MKLSSEVNNTSCYTFTSPILSSWNGF